ncbi:MAG: diguanylate cyclase [Undibacterium sp.]|nr:diguanylate cyclase [Undibacterium sp.]
MTAPYHYNMIEQLHMSERALVNRVFSTQDNVRVIVKILNKEFPSFQEIGQFKREYAIACRCLHAGIVRPLALRQKAGRWTIIQEDINGQSLNKLLHERKMHNSEASSQPAIPLSDFFDIALQLCSALELVHSKGVIHKDINPSNLIWNGELRRLQLIDFGIACELGQETPGIDHPTTLEGTLRYMAPEQTGRMNRIVDYRADYYALGATFYELLTGQPPFAATDAMELVHCHIARTPDWSLPILSSLPGPMLAVLQRLLEKNAEQRYQSLHGLKKDLALCQVVMQEPAQAYNLPASLSGHSGKFLIPQKLYGREREIETLLSAFDRISNGPSEMLLVAGYSGIGKSAVVNEVHKSIVARRGCFVSGKFDQYRRDVPYASLIQAFQELIRQLLSEPQEQVEQWAGQLREALGANIGVIVALIPELELIVGATEPVATLPPVESQNRLNLLFQRFIEVFSSADHPLVIFLDDLQWADAPTLRMIELFMRATDEGYMLFIGAYRDNEVNAVHPLMTLCDQLKTAGVRLTSLTINALTEAHVAHLTADTLRVPAADCAALTSLCYEKTSGNPFFLNQFLHTIHDAGHLSYQFDQDTWNWNMEAINNADYTDNVIDLMLEKIRRLPPETQQLLQLAACIGNRFELETLAVIGTKVDSGISVYSSYQTQKNLWPALEAGLVHPVDQHYKYLGEEPATTQIAYRFLHDRVQQAAYAVANDSEHQKNHLNIGRLMVRHATQETLKKRLFSIVEQLNAGRELIDDTDERLQLAILNQRAGMKARSSAAFDAALRHMRIGIALLPENAWQHHLDLTLDLQLGAAESAYLCGEFAAAEAIYPVVLSHCLTTLQKIRCIAIQAHQYQLQGRLHDAIAILREGLSLLQIEVPQEESAAQAHIAVIFADTERRCSGRSMQDLLTAEEMQDPNDLAAMQLMQGLWMASYYAGQQHLSMLMVLSMTRLSLQRGNCDFTSVAYVAYAFFLAGHQDAEHSYRFGSMAFELARRRTNLNTRSLTVLMFGAIINHWTRPLRGSDALYDDAFNCALDSGDFVQVGVVAAVRATDRLILSQYLPELLQSVERDLALMRSHGHTDLVDCAIAGAVQPIKCLMGKTWRTDSYDDDSFSEARFLGSYGGSRLYQAYFYQGKIRNAYFFDGEDAESLVDKLDIVVQILRGQAKVPETTFYAALILIRVLRRNPQRADASVLFTRIESLRSDLAAWAAIGPDNVTAKYLLVQAEIARYQQDMPLALRCYQQAIDAARDAAYINMQALSNELCGEYWLDQGQHRVAKVFLQDALSHYRQWGADGKVTQLIRQYEALLAETAAHSLSRIRQPAFTSLTENGTTSVSTTSANAALDLASIIKASHALSNEIGLRNVLQRLIAIVCENSGAQVARLLLFNDEIWRLNAEMNDETVSILQERQIILDADSDPQFPLSLLRYVARTGEEIIEDHMAISTKFATDSYVQAHRPRSVMCLPIKQAGLIRGMLYLENNLLHASFTAERVEFLRILAAHAMISISHARLHDSLEQRVAERTAQLEDANRKLATLSATDGLTGLANRRHFDEMLEREWARASRTNQPLAVIMIDVDHFKKYNDCYGHQAGDECLKTIAAILQKGTRRVSDLAARYGGEEFSIVLPNTEASVAHQLAEAVRLSIESLDMTHRQSPLGKVTISVGIAIRSRRENDADSLVRAADEALYRAKNNGRNCIILN